MAFNAERAWCWICKRCGQLFSALAFGKMSCEVKLTQDELLIFCACVCVCVFHGFAVLQHECFHIMLKVKIHEDFMCSVSEHCKGIFLISIACSFLHNFSHVLRTWYKLLKKERRREVFWKGGYCSEPQKSHPACSFKISLTLGDLILVLLI